MAGEPWRRQPKTAKRGWQCGGGDSAQDSGRASKAVFPHGMKAVVTVGGLGGKAGGGHTGGGVEGGSAGGGGGGEGGTICTTR